MYVCIYVYKYVHECMHEIFMHIKQNQVGNDLIFQSSNSLSPRRNLSRLLSSLKPKDTDILNKRTKFNCIRACEMAQQVKCFTHQPGGLGLTPRIHSWRQNPTHEGYLLTLYTCYDIQHVHTHTHMVIIKTFICTNVLML